MQYHLKLRRKSSYFKTGDNKVTVITSGRYNFRGILRSSDLVRQFKLKIPKLLYQIKANTAGYQTIKEF